MTVTLQILIGCLTVFTLMITLACYLFYTKSEVDKKISKVRDESTSADTILKDELLKNINILKDEMHDNELELEKNNSDVKDEIYDKLNENKKALEEGMKQFVQILTDIKEADKDMSLQFITMMNTVKEELKNDYTSRYNDLLLLINTKANESDFNRLENKFDKVSETIIELKTVVQMQLEEKKQ